MESEEDANEGRKVLVTWLLPLKETGSLGRVFPTESVRRKVTCRGLWLEVTCAWPVGLPGFLLPPVHTEESTLGTSPALAFSS